MVIGMPIFRIRREDQTRLRAPDRLDQNELVLAVDRETTIAEIEGFAKVRAENLGGALSFP